MVVGRNFYIVCRLRGLWLRMFSWLRMSILKVVVKYWSVVRELGYGNFMIVYLLMMERRDVDK